MTVPNSPYARLIQAIALDDDEAAEAQIPHLGPADALALLALAQAGGAEAVPVLVDALAADDAGERAVAALALGHLHARAGQAVNPALPSLAHCLADGEGLVRQAAADGLALCGEDAVPVLVAALESPHDGVRVRAVIALRKLQSMRAAAALYQHLNDPNRLVRLYAYETLDAMGLLTNILLRP